MFRAVDWLRDAKVLAELMTFARAEPIDAPELKARQNSWNPEWPSMHCVAERDGAIIAYARAQRMPHLKPGVFFVESIVDKAHLREGLGTAALAQAESFAYGNGATRLRAPVREGSRGEAFARAHDYTPCQRLFGSTLDLSPERIAKLSSLLEFSSNQATIERWNAAADTPGARQSLYQLTMATEEGEPNGEEYAGRDFETFSRDTFGSTKFRPEGVYIAYLDGHPVGVHFVIDHPAERRTEVDYTGVIPAARGTGIARLLKVTAAIHAAERGMTTMDTNNDSDNAPMLAINKKLGYEPAPGWVYVEKAVTR